MRRLERQRRQQVKEGRKRKEAAEVKKEGQECAGTEAGDSEMAGADHSGPLEAGSPQRTPSKELDADGGTGLVDPVDPCEPADLDGETPKTTDGALNTEVQNGICTSHCAALYCTMLYYTISSCIVLCCTVCLKC